VIAQTQWIAIGLTEFSFSGAYGTRIVVLTHHGFLKIALVPCRLYADL